MKIYQVKGNFWLPDYWSHKVKDGKIKYYTKQTGWKTVKIKDEKEIEISNESTFTQIKELLESYGPEVAMEGIINNAECWRENVRKVVKWLTLEECKEYDRFCEHCKTHPQKMVFKVFDWMLFSFGIGSINIVGLDHFLGEVDKDYKPAELWYKKKENVSMQEYLKIIGFDEFIGGLIEKTNPTQEVVNV